MHRQAWASRDEVVHQRRWPGEDGRTLTWIASVTTVRILNSAVEIPRYRRCWDRRQMILDPAHQEALLQLKRKAYRAIRKLLSTPLSDTALLIRAPEGLEPS